MPALLQGPWPMALARVTGARPGSHSPSFTGSHGPKSRVALWPGPWAKQREWRCKMWPTNARGCREGTRSAQPGKSPRPALPAGLRSCALRGSRDATDPPAPVRPPREAGDSGAVTDSSTCPWTVSGVSSSLWFLLFHYYDSDWVGSRDEIV